MLIIRTPFRFPLGGGSTDLPSYYQKYGGFVFGVAVNLYFDVFVRRPVVDEKIHFQYTSYEAVNSADELKHNIGREALRLTGIDKAVDVTFKADIPAGTGLGSSGACAVSLLNALYTYQGQPHQSQFLAEKAFEITERLDWGDGKQDPYLVAFGGFTSLEISPDGQVEVYQPRISQPTIEEFLDTTIVFYTGIRRDSIPILKQQNQARALELKHEIKVIGRDILSAFETGDLRDFGLLLNEHWQIKKELSDQISNSDFDEIYDLAIANGALGGKLMGAGGGGFFMFYCRDKQARLKVSQTLTGLGLKGISFGIDYGGSRVLLNVL